MDPAKPVSRRHFLQIAALASLSGSTLVSCSSPTRRWRFLSDNEALLVETLSEQIIPTDEDPGGKWANVVRFVDRQLAGPYLRFRNLYRQGLSCLQSTSQAVHGKFFLELNWDQQTQLLTRLENDQVPEGIWVSLSSSKFFGILCEHCLQGFYGSPRHGGNRDGISWRMLDLGYPQVSPRTGPGSPEIETGVK
ncbi:MAG: gluconate 2-dehydrogenase subunit 3 family protein [Acidobacteriota bacterium]